MSQKISETKKQEIINDAKKEIIRNQMLSVKGERLQLPLKDRSIEVIYYKATLKNAPLLVCVHRGGFLFGIRRTSKYNDCRW